jgi:hypothetical protein
MFWDVNFTPNPNILKSLDANKSILLFATIFLFPLKILKNKISFLLDSMKLDRVHIKFFLTLIFITISISFLISYSFNPFIYIRF